MGLFEQRGFFGGHYLPGLFDAAAGPLDDDVAQLAAGRHRQQMIGLRGDELLQDLLPLVELLLAEGRVALQAGAFDERDAFLVGERFLELHRHVRVVRRGVEILDRHVEVAPLAEAVEEGLGRLDRQRRRCRQGCHGQCGQRDNPSGHERGFLSNRNST